MSTFDNVSAQYRKKALVQQKAAAKLIKLLSPGKTEDVIDVACGPGHVTALLASMTSGRVLGTDISAGMIEQARANYPSIEFRQVAADALDYVAVFDAAFCNSSFQWFAKPLAAIQAIHRALKKGGRLALANPATTRWAPWFATIIARVAADKDIASTFNHWRNPWFFLPEEDDYRKFFESAGFTTLSIAAEYETAYYTPDEAYGIYLSGAANGFANKQFYDIPVSDDYLALFNRAVKKEIEDLAVNGKVLADFTRLYYLGSKK
jgi:ubiquinone/menaquinone biosynthesis C-methylase UbiE